MHELSIALSIVEIAEKQAKIIGAKEIEEIEIDIGSLAGVEINTLLFALQSVIKGSILENANIIRNNIEAEGECGECNNIFFMNNLYDPCTICGSYLIFLKKGKELRIKSLLVKK